MAFGLCAVLYVPLFALKRTLAARNARFAWAAALAIVVGGVLELWQASLPYRSAEWDDFWADVLGAVLGGWLGWRGTLWLAQRQREGRLEPSDGG